MTDRPRLTSAQADRAAGVLLAQAAGDALGAPTEFQVSPLPADTPIAMTGGGHFGWEPGEWTDDTQMSIVILDAALAAQSGGQSLHDRLDDVAAGWLAWSDEATDVGSQTGAVLSSRPASAAAMAEAATAHHARKGRSGGNGSLMRTAPVALALLGDRAGTARTARAVSDMTHHDPDAGDACVLWCAAIQHAILHGDFDLVAGLDLLSEERRARWATRITEAEQNEATAFDRNGWVVHALQAAWSLITRTPVPPLDPAHGSYPAQHLRLVLESAARLANDTDTVAAIAGALLGARWGASAVPAEWRRIVHGWPGLTGADLARRGLALTRGGGDDAGWPLGERVDYTGSAARGRLAQHPHDPGVWLGDVTTAENPPEHIDAIVSLCRIGTRQFPGFASTDVVDVWLVDTESPDSNPNLHFVLTDAADAIAAFRADGKTVLVHCVAAQSRTPTVAAVYAVRHRAIDAGVALDEVCAVLPDPAPNRAFQSAVGRTASLPLG